MTTHPRLAAALLAAVTGLTASPALAQIGRQPAAEPVQPVEGEPVPADPRRVPVFDVTADVFGARDAAVGDAPAGFPAPEPQTYWGGNLSTAFQRPGRRMDLTGTVGASVRRYAASEDGLLPSYSGSVRLDAGVGRRGSLGIGQTLSYGPMNVLSFFESGATVQNLALAPVVDYRVSPANQLVSETRLDYSQQLSRRGSLSGGVGFGVSEADGETDLLNLQSYKRWDVSMRYTHQATRYASWYAGYGLAQGLGRDRTVFTAPPTEEVPVPAPAPVERGNATLHNIDVGVAYDRPLSFSRRTHVSFRVGGAVVEGTQDISSELRAVGMAGISHEIGRTWLAQATYNRDTHFTPLFPDPTLSDTLSIGLSGFLTRTASVSVLANLASGRVGLQAVSGDYQATTASASIRQALARRVALYAEYFYFDADFGDGVALADLVLTRVRRHGFRVGVSFGTNLIGRGRQPRMAAGVGDR